MRERIKIIGFDADDTLWLNEIYFKETEKMFCDILSEFQSNERISHELLKTELQNLDIYGYGVKGFILSMIETALRVSDNKLDRSVIDRIIQLGKDQISKPVILLDGIKDILEKLVESGYKLIIATKGDLLDQERKLKKSNLEKYFHHVEIMSDKKELNYQKLLFNLDIAPENFLMIGNSLKSDILPVLNIGGYAVYIPHHTSWVHETIEKKDNMKNFWEIEQISAVMKTLDL